MSAPADWQLPPGVSRAVWEYVHDSTLAAEYDAGLADSPLLDVDLAFIQRHLPPSPRIIDLGCGTGRTAMPLAHAGCEVVGIDLSEPMLQQARGKDPLNQVTWVCGNIVELAAFGDCTFDAAICMFSTLGMIAGQAGRKRVVAEARRILRPGGIFIVHAHCPGHHLLTRRGRRIWLRDRLRRLRRHQDAGDVPMPAAAGRSGWTMHLFTRLELVRLLETAGFSLRTIEAIDVHGAKLPWSRRWLAYGFLAAAVAKPRPS